MKNQEVWKDVKNYEGIYQVSNLGRVKSLKRRLVPRDKILKSNFSGSGYLHLSLSKDGKSKTILIHQLVSESFLNHTYKGRVMVVDHIDNDKTNNMLSNLQIITHRHNSSKDKNSSSGGYTGVYQQKGRNTFRAIIRINGVTHNLGSYKTALEASDAYQNKLNDIELDFRVEL